MTRVAFYIDGFNIYHSLDEKAEYHRYKWLNYAAFADLFCSPKEEVTAVFLFTAYYHWSPDKVSRHKKLVAALESVGVETVLGRFKKKDRYCRFGHKCEAREEKETDVNIAIKLLQGAIDNIYDTAIILSGDSDLVPAIRGVKESFKEKRIGVLFPMERISYELEKIADFHLHITPKPLEDCQFPDVVTLSDGRQVHRPRTWK